MGIQEYREEVWTKGIGIFEENSRRVQDKGVQGYRQQVEGKQEESKDQEIEEQKDKQEDFIEGIEDTKGDKEEVEGTKSEKEEVEGVKEGDEVDVEESKGNDCIKDYNDAGVEDKEEVIVDEEKIMNEPDIIEFDAKPNPKFLKIQVRSKLLMVS